MSRIIAFPPARPVVRDSSDIPALDARLSRIEQTDSPDEAMMDLLLVAEADALRALASTRAETLEDATLKLATLLRRVAADGEGFVPEPEMALLRGVLRDLRRLSGGKVAARA